MKKLMNNFKRIIVYIVLSIISLSYVNADLLSNKGMLTGVASDITAKHIGSGGGGSMFAIAIHPTDEENIYISNDMGLVSHTLDGGKNWKMVPGMYQIRFIQFDKKNPNTLWAGGGSGLYKSIDGGVHWNYSFKISNYNANLGAIGIDPTDSNILYVAEGFLSRIKIPWVRGKVWKSTDGGENWKELTRPGGILGNAGDPGVDSNYNRNYSTIIIDPKSSYAAGKGHSRVYLVGQDAIFKTENAGESWKDISFFSRGQGSEMVLVEKNNKSVLFASVIPVTGEVKGGIYRSDDNGESWEAKNSGLDSIISRLKSRNKRIKNNSKFSLMIAHGLSDPNRLYVGSWQGLAKSTDMGESWVQTTLAETKYIRHASGKFMGIPSTSRINHSKTFFGGIDNFMIMRVSDSNPDLVIFTDNKDVHITQNGGSSWESALFDYTERFEDTDNVIPTLPEGSPKNRYTHKMKARGAQTTVNTDAAIDPFDSNVYYATYMDMGMQISRDGGESWEHPSNGIPENGHAWSILVDPAREGYIWVSAREKGGIYLSTDKGETWSDRSIGDTSVGKVADMVLDSRSSISNRLLYAATENKGIYKSINGGKSWHKVLDKGGLEIKLDPSNADIVYAGTNTGIYKSTDKGENWVRLVSSDIGKVHNMSIGKENRIYVVSNKPNDSNFWSLRKLWKSEDGGVTFIDITPHFMHFIGAVEVNPDNPEYIYIANFLKHQTQQSDKLIMARSKNGGVTWEQIGENFAFAMGTDIYINPKNHQQVLFSTRFALIEILDENISNVDAPDTTKPVIFLKGNSSMSIPIGEIYIEKGATANDNIDGNITGKIRISGIVNSEAAGKYYINYDVNDSAGNAATRVVRTVIVTKKDEPDTTKPVIILNGSSSVSIPIGETYIEKGATASDNIDGNITGKIRISGIVNSEAAGKYYINYDVNDSAGNAATKVVRTVIVTKKDENNLLDQIYEDAEDGLVTRWRVYGNQSGEAKVSNVYDSKRKSHVIELSGDHQNDAYILGGRRDSRKWNNTTAKNIRWSMNYTENVSIYISIKTVKGTRSLKYTNSDRNYGATRGHIHHGLGSNIIDGTWRTFNRDLEADLKEFEPDNSIIAVNAFSVRGSGRFDDISLY